MLIQSMFRLFMDLLIVSMLSWNKHVWNNILLVGEGRFHVRDHFTIGGWQTCRGKKLLSVPRSDWSLSESREALPCLSDLKPQRDSSGEKCVFWNTKLEHTWKKEIILTGFWNGLHDLRRRIFFFWERLCDTDEGECEGTQNKTALELGARSLQAVSKRPWWRLCAKHLCLSSLKFL